MPAPIPAARPAFCAACPLVRATTGYIPLQRHSTGQGGTLLVAEAPDDEDLAAGMPLASGDGRWLHSLAARAGLRRSDFDVINSIGCVPPDGIYPADKKWRATSKADALAGLAHCKQHHLEPTLRASTPRRIVALGDEALTVLTGKKGALIWRGSSLPLRGAKDRALVMPTLAPSYIAKDQKMASIVVGDLRKSIQTPPEYYELYAQLPDLQGLHEKKLSLDFEWDHNHNITLVGLGWRMYQAQTGAFTGATQDEYRRILEEATDIIGHNVVGAEYYHMQRLGWSIRAKLHCTMLKQHLLQPAYKHGLDFVASVWTNKVFWKGRGDEEEDEYGNLIDTKVQWKTWADAEAIPRELGGYGGCASADEAYRLYNARDTDAGFQINQELDLALAKYGLENVYWNVSLPVAHICSEMSNRGLRIDSARIKELNSTLSQEIAVLEQTLPEGLKPYDKAIIKQIPAPPGSYKARTKVCKGTRKLPHDPTTLTFLSPGSMLQCPSCEREVTSGKLTELKRIKIPATQTIVPWNSPAQVTKYARTLGLKPRWDRKRGSEAADKLARKSWGRTHSEFRIIDALKEKGTMRSNFAKESLMHLDRMFFNMLVHGTSEGRFSSAGKRKGIDLNCQNQPKSFRCIYIPEQPDWSFIELDYSQGENMLTAYLANDHERLARLQTPGYSEHLDLAKRIFNLPPDILKYDAQRWQGQDLYDIGKHVNHGSNYGMTHVKLKEYCESEGYFFSEKECKEFIRAGELLNPGTTLWKRQTIETAKRDGFLRNPFGRMLWFSSRDVATKSLAFLPASTLADICIRAMIAHYPARFGPEVQALGLSVYADLMPEVLLSIQVHDALVLQGPNGVMLEQAYRTKAVMEQPWAELQGFALKTEVTMGDPGKSWGEVRAIHI